ncbi:hypothetical protein DFS34DRAFT_598512 [Phlyctochytrium arcticum]|nr:hypothetical protein DFS34DRAFT_598512 [Phlyctochytrium arcticum]
MPLYISLHSNQCRTFDIERIRLKTGENLQKKEEMNEFYKQHGLLASEVEEELFKKDIMDEVLNKYDNGLLTFKGKGGVVTTVTNSKQAFAMAHAIAKKKWQRVHAEESQYFKGKW